MGKIHVLDKQTAELIAAGEVVDRPASVIKELTENAVDAGASTITVEIRRGGITFMRVTDDGSGMDREDVPVAFVRHATSKVRSREDLDGIGTLGFRGEALASIGAVAHVEVLTRTAEALEGTRFEMNGGEPGETAAVGCPRGTTILVRDLFYNTPARMKFLKKDVSEANAVAAMMDRLALSHPEISFRFIRDGKETLHTPGDGKIRSAVYAVYGREFTSQLLPVEYEFSHVKVEGFVSAPAASRGSRSMQHFFLNGRYVRSRTAMAALEEACKGSIMVGRYPACILYITMNTHAVDVNVHPAKLEVRFVNERPVYDGVYHGVKSALLQKDAPRTMQLPGGPGLSRQNVPLTGTQTVLNLGEKLQAAPGGRPIAGEPAVSRQPQPIAAGQAAAHSAPAVPAKKQPGLTEMPAFLQPDSRQKPAFLEEPERPVYQGGSRLSEKEKPETQTETETVPSFLPPPVGQREEESSSLGERNVCAEKREFRLLGEAFHTYILLQIGEEELMLIDKHAAHERLLYEKLRREQDHASAQMLLQPVMLTLTKEEFGVLMEHSDLLDRAGFACEDFGGGSLLVRSVPLTLEGQDVPGALTEIAGYLLSHRREISTEKLDWLFHNVACRAAIKAGDFSAPQELAALCMQLYENPQVRYCPHGRPVFVVLKRREIEKQFGRV